MNKTGRLTLIKTTLTAMPIYTPINLELQIWLLKGMTKLMKGFLWSGTEVAQGGGGASASLPGARSSVCSSWVAWESWIYN
jgi:hypothetical protein